MLKRGFTLLEVIVSMFIVTLGVGSVFALVAQTVDSTRNVSSKLTAIYLAQEGMEIVRNIRDTNWLEQRTNPEVLWDEGIVSGDWQPVSFIDGTQSNFQRKTMITREGSDILKVSVSVSWQGRGGPHTVTVQENLYKWMQ